MRHAKRFDEKKIKSERDLVKKSSSAEEARKAVG
jgi:hypothetical protein